MTGDEDNEDVRQTVGTADEINALAHQYVRDALDGRDVDLKVFKLVPQSPADGGHRDVKWDWIPLLQTSDVKTLFTEGFKMLHDPRLPF
jgi:hypothetical protein